MPDRAPSEQRLREIAGILAGSEQAGGPGAEAVALGEPGDVPRSPEAILDRLDARVAAVPAAARLSADGSGRRAFIGGAGDGPPGNVVPGSSAEALAALRKFGGSALAKVGNHNFALSRDEACAMEAIVVADGSRPSFIVRHGEADGTDPFIGTWGDELDQSRAAMARVAGAVGRIQPTGGNASVYIGSGTLIDRANRLVLTNFHVVDEAENRFGIGMQHAGNRLTVSGNLEIDFAAESGSLDERRFRISEIVLPQGFGRMFAGIDAAVCRIEPIEAGDELPEAVLPLSADPDFLTGAILSLAVIGFPGPPAMDKGDKVDWDFVVGKLFRNRFGIKRLAPGRLLRGLGTHPDDTVAKRAIGHDATTFGGASGALLTSWLDPGAPAFALHLGGETTESNYALAFARARQALEAIGVPFA